MLNTPSWLDCTIPFRQKTSYTLSWILSMVEKWVFVVEKLKADICLITSQKPLFGQCVINIAIADADSDIWHCITLRDSVPKNESSAIIYSSSFRSKPVWLPFFVEQRRNIFGRMLLFVLWKSVGTSLTYMLYTVQNIKS